MKKYNVSLNRPRHDRRSSNKVRARYLTFAQMASARGHTGKIDSRERNHSHWIKKRVGCPGQGRTWLLRTFCFFPILRYYNTLPLLFRSSPVFAAKPIDSLRLFTRSWQTPNVDPHCGGCKTTPKCLPILYIYIRSQDFIYSRFFRHEYKRTSEFELYIL